jgi:hypothetical protein
MLSDAFMGQLISPLPETSAISPEPLRSAIRVVSHVVAIATCGLEIEYRPPKSTIPIAKAAVMIRTEDTLTALQERSVAEEPG